MSSAAPQAPAPRISAKLRQAMRLHVREGLSITAATERAGMTRQGWHKAMKRPAVKAELAAEKGRFVAEVEGSRAIYTAQALEVAADLMRHAKSESVRARMVEFLAGDGRAQDRLPRGHTEPSHAGPGYHYSPPAPPVPALADDEGDEFVYFDTATRGHA